MVNKMKLNIVNIKDIKPYKNNPRKHSKKHIHEIERSIKEFGFTNPVLVDEFGEILAGHGRYYAALNLKLETIPVINLKDLTSEKKRLYRITDNKLTENGRWDEDLLALEFKDLAELNLDLDLDITGFSTTEIDLSIDSLNSEFQETAELLEDFDEDYNPVTKLGDVWLLGNNRLLCGDSLLDTSYKVLMNNQKAHAIFTDPPYNVKIDKNVCGLGGVKHEEFQMASGEMSDSEFQTFLNNIFAKTKQNSEPGSIHFYCMDWRHIENVLVSGRENNLDLKNICIWDKGTGGMGSLYRSQHEMVAVFKNGKENHINNVELGKHGRYRTNVWTYSGVNSFGSNRKDLKIHPTVKPIPMVMDAMKDVTKRNQIILDPFSGSGSTLIAAQKTGRICYAIEIDPKYVDRSIERFQTKTGIEVIHAESNKTFGEIKQESLNVL